MVKMALIVSGICFFFAFVLFQCFFFTNDFWIFPSWPHEMIWYSLKFPCEENCSINSLTRVTLSLFNWAHFSIFFFVAITKFTPSEFERVSTFLVSSFWVVRVLLNSQYTYSIRYLSPSLFSSLLLLLWWIFSSYDYSSIDKLSWCWNFSAIVSMYHLNWRTCRNPLTEILKSIRYNNKFNWKLTVTKFAILDTQLLFLDLMSDILHQISLPEKITSSLGIIFVRDVYFALTKKKQWGEIFGK